MSNITPPPLSLPTHGHWSRGRLSFQPHRPAAQVGGRGCLPELWFMALEAMPWERLQCPKSKQAFTQGAWPKTETGGGDGWGRCEGGVGQSSQPKLTGGLRTQETLWEEQWVGQWQLFCMDFAITGNSHSCPSGLGECGGARRGHSVTGVSSWSPI